MVQREPEFPHDVETAVVTGAIGDVGSWVVDRLADRGIQVVGVDLDRPEGTRTNAEFRAVDLRDQAETWETFYETDPDVIVHLAAISNPIDVPGSRVFDNNVSSTYNVMVAAGRMDVDVRDVARVIEAAISSDHVGQEVVLCVADENYLGQPTAELVEAIGGNLPETCNVHGKEAAFSNEKAERLFGWTPSYSVPEHDPDERTGPTWR